MFSQIVHVCHGKRHRRATLPLITHVKVGKDLAFGVREFATLPYVVFILVIIQN
jgi:hypothetical protein